MGLDEHDRLIAYVLGLSGALTGPNASVYAPVVEGIKLHVDTLNARGGETMQPAVRAVTHPFGGLHEAVPYPVRRRPAAARRGTGHGTGRGGVLGVLHPRRRTQHVDDLQHPRRRRRQHHDALRYR